MKKNLLLVVMCLFAIAASAKTETKKVTFNVPLHCEGCVSKVEKNIAFEKGVKGLVCNIEKQTVEVTYLPKKTNVEDLKKGFAKIGYENVTLAKAKCCSEEHEHAEEKEHKPAKCCEKEEASCEKKQKSCCSK